MKPALRTTGCTLFVAFALFCAAGAAAAQPNLTVVTVSVPAEAGTSDQVPVRILLSAGGTEPASSEVRIGATLIAENETSVPDANGLQGLQTVDPPLQPGATREVTIHVRAPAQASTLRAAARVDVDSVASESDEQDNTGISTSTIRVEPSDADLIVTAVAAPGSAAAGDTIPVTVTVKNAGTGRVKLASAYSIVLTTDEAIDGSDPVLVSERAVPALTAGESFSEEVFGAVPGDLPGGSYRVVCIADTYGWIHESNESNNLGSASPISIGSPQIDLEVTAFAAPPAADLGVPFTVTATIANRGSSPLERRGRAGVFLARDRSATPTDAEVASLALPDLAAGASAVLTLSCELRPGTTPGLAVLTAIADPDATIGETSESNNSRDAAAPLDILAPRQDVVASFAKAPASLRSGGIARARITVANPGAGPTLSSHDVALYLSANALLDDADLKLTSRSVASLPAGGSTTLQLEAALPTGLGAGVRFLLAQADSGGSLVEADETNNVASVQVLVELPRVDLVAQAVVAPPSGRPGQLLPVHVRVSNSGSADSGPFDIDLYLSRSAAITTDSLLQVDDAESQGGLGAGETRLAGPYFVPIPHEEGAGSRFVVAVLDSLQRVEEISETNNTVSGPATALSTAVPIPDDHPDTAGDAVSPRDLLPSDGTPLAGVHERARDVDFYVLNVPANGLVVIDAQTSLAGGAFPSIELFGLNGKRLAFNDGTEKSKYQARVGPLAGLPAGAYRVAIGESAEFGAGSYVVRAFAEAGRPDLAVTISPPVPEAISTSRIVAATVTVTNIGSATAPSGAVLRVLASPKEAVSTAGTLLTQVELPLLRPGAGISRALAVPVDVYSLPPGSYAFGAQADPDRAVPEVELANNLATAAGRLTVAALGDDHPGSLELASDPTDTLTPDAPGLEGQIEAEGDVDFFRFKAESRGEYVVRVTAGTLTRFRMQLFLDSTENSPGVFVEEGFGGVGELLFRSDFESTAYVRIEALDADGSGSYTVRVTRVESGSVDDYPAAANEFPPRAELHSQHDGELGRAGDVDLLTFDLRAGIGYRFAVRGKTQGLRAQLLGPDASTVLATLLAGADDSPAEATLTAASTGAHFVRIDSAAAAATGRWQFYFTFDPLPSFSVEAVAQGRAVSVSVSVTDLVAPIDVAKIPVVVPTSGLELDYSVEPGPAAAGLALTTAGAVENGAVVVSMAPEGPLDPSRPPVNGTLFTLRLRAVPDSQISTLEFGLGALAAETPFRERYELSPAEADPGVDQDALLQARPDGTLFLSRPDPLDPAGAPVAFVRLDGTRSADPSLFPSKLTYRWSVTTSPVAIALAGAESASPTFAPTAPGFYEFALRVRGAALEGPAEFVGVEVEVSGRTPTAVARAENTTTGERTSLAEPLLIVPAGQQVLLDGTGSLDPDGQTDQPLTYRWEQHAGPSVTLSPSATDAAPSFVPVASDNYRFSLEVEDAEGFRSLRDYVTIAAGDPPPSLSIVSSATSTRATGAELPRALDEVEDRSLRVTLPTTVTLRAVVDSNATNATSDVLFFWQQVSGPEVVLDPIVETRPRSRGSRTVFMPTTARVYEFECFAGAVDLEGNVKGASSTRRVRVVVDSPGNSIPVSTARASSPSGKAGPALSAGQDDTLRIGAGAAVRLDGSGSRDANDLLLAYRWTQISGPTVLLSNPFSSVTTFVSPAFASPATLVFALFVDDGEARSAPARAVVQVASAALTQGSLETGRGVHFVGLPVTVPIQGRSYHAGDLGADTGARLVGRLGAAGRFGTFVPGAGAAPFAVMANEGYVVMSSRPPGRANVFGNLWPEASLQRSLQPGLNLVSMPRGVPAGYTLADLATLTGSRFVGFTAPGPRGSQVVLYFPGLSGPAPAVTSGKAYLLSVPSSRTVSLPGR